jgi:hypothetical protein
LSAASTSAAVRSWTSGEAAGLELGGAAAVAAAGGHREGAQLRAPTRSAATTTTVRSRERFIGAIYTTHMVGVTERAQ